MIVLRTGTPGAGKSYHAIKSIQKDIEKGYIIITNIEGIKKELFSNPENLILVHNDLTRKKELFFHSTVLSSELIKELQSASKITLKVNPKDHGAISEHVGSMEHIEVVSDSAVSEGGVIALSDAGNIDATIKERFDMAKSVLFEDE